MSPLICHVYTLNNAADEKKKRKRGSNLYSRKYGSAIYLSQTHTHTYIYRINHSSEFIKKYIHKCIAKNMFRRNSNIQILMWCRTFMHKNAKVRADYRF